MDWTEVAGFVTGAACVALVVRRSVWNFPVGIANNVLFLVLFTGAGLYGDAALQVLYIALAVLGWWAWLRGGPDRGPLTCAARRGGSGRSRCCSSPPRRGRCGRC